MTFSGIRAVVTGGASGIGAATAGRLRDEGAAVAVLDRDPSKGPGGDLALTCDVSDDAAVRDAVAAAADALGGIDVLVNCAGVGAQGGVEANADEEWHRVFDVNVVGSVRVIRAALPYLRRSAHAAIVNTGSIAATTGLPSRVLYSATKGAVDAMTRAMATDLLPEGIRVNAVDPGTTQTPWVDRLLATAADPEAEARALAARQPHGRLVLAEEVADTICFLASPRSGSTTGTCLPVDGGGHSLRPRR